jgi:hypothetical protein
MGPVLEMRRLCHLKSRQNLPRHFCRVRVSATMPLKSIDDLALMQKVSFAVADMALDIGEVIEKRCAVHAR